MRTILPFDELNVLITRIRAQFSGGLAKRSREEEEDIIDEMLDLFLLAYAQGNSVTSDSLSSEWMPKVDEVMATVDAKVAGKTWRERVHEHFEQGGTADDLVRIAETETHRIANTAAFDTARHCGAENKTWHCMMLPTSRDSHIYLDNVTVPMDAEFYSINGGSTLFPGEWGIAEEDVNCLCWLTFE